ncbi:hypothetical protein [Thermostaphylospora chromogena]|uniref:Uncharacterized protein n=1 Tax=Thermostaphylospora chromogena TaxID=35622 RepID=A0A1H1CWP0_9ACTN|nr:hypothetical protein [Thermostaphylospora chromogena]SDQ68665.1 hypothetical protein SAMN04489764_1692 [Thermostaphylospora chromogena]
MQPDPVRMARLARDVHQLFGTSGLQVLRAMATTTSGPVEADQPTTSPADERPAVTAHRPVEALKPAELPRAPEPVDPVRAAYQRSQHTMRATAALAADNTTDAADQPKRRTHLPVESLRPGALPLGDPDPVDPIRAALERRGH